MVYPHPDVAEQSNTGTDAHCTGTVYRKTTGHYYVSSDNGNLVCTISSKLRKQLVYPIAAPSSLRHRVRSVEDIRAIDPVAIGDQVRFVAAGDGTGLLTEVLPRRNKLVRRAAGPKALEQVIAANVDQMVAIVAAAEPTPKWERVDRYLAAAESLDLPSLICITKLDLVEEAALADEIAAYRRIGYPVILTSMVRATGIDEMRTALAARTSVLVGVSGAGKTSLLNTVQPGLGQRVGEVSGQTGKGKHTTTHLELFPLDWGGALIDTPGMREFALWEIDDADLASAFPEMRPYLGRCQFGLGCEHDREPGCAIKEAVAAGTVTERRYRSYLHMKGHRKG